MDETLFGDPCCAMRLDGKRRPMLGLDPSPGVCDSANAQLMVSGMCLGRSNCTIDVNANATQFWKPSRRWGTDCDIRIPDDPWGEDGAPVTVSAGSSQPMCKARFNGRGNFTECPENGETGSSFWGNTGDGEVKRLLVVGNCIIRSEEHTSELQSP